jgi:hypothetical protein
VSRPTFPLLRLAPLLTFLAGLTVGAPLYGRPAPQGGHTGAPLLSADEGYGLLRRLAAGSPEERRAAARALAEAGDASLVPGLVDAYFFLPRGERADALAALVALTGERPGERYHDWVELVGRRQDLAPKPGYLAFKAGLLSRIDPRFKALLYDGAPARIRPEEIVFGGVPVEGIPALDRPDHVPAAAASYLSDSERVFGVSVKGEARAYPLRILDWHEMVNDVVGGEPVTLSYCTLCGSGVLYATRGADGIARTFGTSGLLYRSNKLMVDRQTRTLWSNLTGEAVLGRLAGPGGPARLAVLPVVVTTWQEWRRRHPATTVLALDSALERKWGFRYLPGAAEQRRAGVTFPIWLRSGALDPRAEVYAVRLGERAKAYPVERAVKERVINDTLGGEPLVVVADPGSGAVRAYRRGGRTFKPGRSAAELADAGGRRWTVGEEALAPVEPDPEAPPLPRLPGHASFWLGWYAFFPHSELYGGPPR